jgi:phosphoribosylanthranilate isomerase
MWVKICGTTNLEDAQASIEAGADALGFVFAPSTRRISPKDVGKITAQIAPAVEKFGVFVNQSPEIIVDTVRKAQLTGVQLQGDEEPVVAHELKELVPGLKVFKTIHMREAQIAEMDLKLMAAYDGLLFDSGTKENRGGTGIAFDWSSNAPMIRFLTRKFRVIIAGGLTPMNVGQALRLFAPAGVDVVSGVEREPGRKDHDKVRAFIAAAKRTETD